MADSNRGIFVGVIALAVLGCTVADAQNPPRRISIQDFNRILMRESEEAAIQALENSTLTPGQLSEYTYLGKFTVLNNAIKKNSEKLVDALLKKEADPNRASPFESPLHVAAYGGRARIITRLLDVGARINQKDVNGETPLMTALRNRREDIAIQLLKRRANWRTPNRWQETALHFAAQYNASEALRFMLERGADPAERSGAYDRPLLFWAVGAGANQVVMMLLESGVDPSARDRFDYAPLFEAAAAPRGTGCIHLLLAYEADPNSRHEQSGWTALHFAAIHGNAKSVEVLGLAGADPNARDHRGRTPLHLAVLRGHVLNVASLLVQQADPNIQDIQGNTPMHLATRQNDSAVIRVLGGAELDLSLVDEFDKSPSDWAREISNADLNAAYAAIGHDLIQKRVSSDSDKQSPAQGAVRAEKTPLLGKAGDPEPGHHGILPVLARRGNVEAVRRRLEIGHDPNEAGHVAGWTALHFAAASGNEALVRLLLEHGADANRKDGIGRAPEHVAAIMRERVIYDLLRAEGDADPAPDDRGNAPEAYWNIDPVAVPAPTYYGFFPKASLYSNYRDP